MAAYLHSLATAVPAHAYDQEGILAMMKAWHGQDRRVSRLLSGMYLASAIDRRHSVIDDFRPGSNGGFFYQPAAGEADDHQATAGAVRDPANMLGSFRNPTTAERNDVYAREAGRLASCAARKAMSSSGVLAPGDVTHLISMSCTGFYAPGVDFDVMRQLGLPQQVERYHLGFMGCYAALPAMRLARSICLAHSDAVVLIVSVELCTLHLQAGTTSDELLAAAVFADGAAAAIVTARPPSDRPSLRLAAFNTAVVTDAEADMAWTIGDTGFLMTLSNKIPRVVEGEVGAALAPLWRAADLAPVEIAAWAVHPGGRAILDSFEVALQLPQSALVESREVLRQYGNMSSATVLFVIERMLAAESRPAGPIAAVAFGPGLTVESALLHPAA